MPRKILVFIGIVISFILFIIVAQFGPQILKIKKVSCQLNDQTCPPELIQKLSSIEGESFLFLPLETYIRNLNINLHQLESISKSWPATVSLKFSHKPNSYLIKTSPQNTLLITENGLAQPITTQQNLPLIEAYSWPDSIQKDQLEAQLHQLNLDLVRFLAGQNISYKNIKIKSPQEIEILLQADLVALVQKDQLEKQIIKLAIILSEIDLNAIDLQINRIDLRFKFPLLKTTHATQS